MKNSSSIMDNNLEQSSKHRDDEEEEDEQNMVGQGLKAQSNKESTSFLQDVAKSLTIEHSTFNQSGISGEEETKIVSAGMFQRQSSKSNSNAQCADIDEKSDDGKKEQSQKLKLQQEKKSTVNSNVFVWGNNQHGQLTLSEEMTLVQDPVAIRLEQIEKITSVACGEAHTLILSENGIVFAMGNNSYAQLGASKAIKQRSRTPILVKGLTENSSMRVTQVACAANSSFAVMKPVANSGAGSDELYSWGCSADGVLGLKQSLMPVDGAVANPTKVEFAEASEQMKIEHVSLGESHGALLTTTRDVYVWGTNSMGELGLDDTESRLEPCLNSLITDQQAILVSCGNRFTFLISGLNEIMISGKLPFAVKNDQGEDQNFISTFQSIAQFDQRVQIMQVEASRFASIVVDPVEDDQPRELFLWGQSPLGVFNELTPLNQLFASSYEQSEQQNFNVKAVKNGQNFCVFIDNDSGMTYQIGAENMIDPYIDDALVSLSELRDAQFGDVAKFACGHNFVVGESMTPGIAVSNYDSVAGQQSLQRLGEQMLSPARKQISEIKEQAAEIEMSMQLVSPDGSKQSFPQRALYQGSISPSTPTQITSMNNSCSGYKSVQFKHRDLGMGGTGVLRHGEGCKPVLLPTGGTPKVKANKQDGKGVLEMVAKPTTSMPHLLVQQRKALQTEDDVKTDEIVIEQQEDQEMPATSDSQDQDGKSVEQNLKSSNKSANMCQDDEEARDDEDEDLGNITSDRSATPNVQQAKIKESQQRILFHSQMKNEKKPNFSPEVSPINGVLHDTMRDSNMDNNEQAAWMIDATGYNMCGEANAQQMPLQMQQSPHLIYQSYPQPFPMRSPDRIQHQSAIGGQVARYLPVQQIGSNFKESSQQSQRQRHSIQIQHPSYNTASIVSAPLNLVHQPSVSQSQLNVSGFLNMSQHQSQFQHTHHQQQQQEATQQQSFYELMMKEKLESATLAGQLKEAQRQLDKSRKAYSKLLSQVDEDQAETAQLREQTRRQEIQLGEAKVRYDDQAATIEKMQAEKTKLESELKQSNQRCQQVQNDLTLAQIKVKEVENRLNQKQQTCLSDACKQSLNDAEQLASRRSKEIYELTVKLGCIESENTELKSQIEDNKLLYSGARIDSQRLQVEQDLEEAHRSINELTAALAQSQKQLTQLRNKKCVRHQSVQTKAQQKVPIKMRVGSDEDFPHFFHSTQKAQESKVMILPVIPTPCYEAVEGPDRMIEADQSFDISISFNQLEQQDSSLGPEDYHQHGDHSLHELKCLEKAAIQRQSTDELHRLNAAGHHCTSQRITSGQKNFQKSQASEYEYHQDEPRPKHNFMNNNRSGSKHGYEPQILRKSSALQKQSSRNVLIPVSSAQQKFDQNRSTNFAPNFPELKEKYSQQQHDSMFHIGDNSGDAEQSWQTFKPSTVCPNERYSLKRHQEIFMESQCSQKDDSADQNEQELSNFGQAAHIVKQGSQTARRAKSNSDAGCLHAASQKTRRLRHQRQAQAVKKSDSSCGDGVSQRSFGAKSNLTTPIRTDRSGTTQKMMISQPCELSQKDSDAKRIIAERGSQLKRPTRLTKSPSTKAILAEMDESRARLQNHFNNVMTVQSQSDVDKFGQESQPCQTPAARQNLSNSGFFSQKRSSTGQNYTSTRPKVYSHLAATSRPNMTARPNVSQPNLITGSQAHSQQQSALKTQMNQQHHSHRQQTAPSQTPRVKSQGTLQANAANALGRQSQQRSNMMQDSSLLHSQTTRGQSSGATGTNQAVSAAARRVAYDAKRKLAMQKSMTNKSQTMTQSQHYIQQAQMAASSSQVCSTTSARHHMSTMDQLQPVNTSVQLSVMEEPFANPPQRAKKPEMSVHQDDSVDTVPMMLSARMTATSHFNNNSAVQLTATSNPQQTVCQMDKESQRQQEHQKPNPFTTEQVNNYTSPGELHFEKTVTPIAASESCAPKEPPQLQQNPLTQSHQARLRSSTNSKISASSHAAQSTTLRSRSGTMIATSHQNAAQNGANVTSSYNNRSDSSPQDDSNHLNDMKEKLHKIQSNKMLLEKKIQEYETKLKKISQDKQTQDIWAKAKQQQKLSNQQSTTSHKQHQQVYNSTNSRNTSRSTENIFAEQSSDYTLGDTHKTSSSKRHNNQLQTTSRQSQPAAHIMNTQERVRRQHRTALQQLATNNNHSLNSQITQSVLSKSQHSTSTAHMMGAGGYRDCQMRAVQAPQNRIKAPPSVMPKTHYANQTIFRH